MKQVRRVVSLAWIVSLLLAQSDELNALHGLQNFQGNQLDLPQTVSYFSVMGSAQSTSDLLSQDMAPSKQKALLCWERYVIYSQHSYGMVTVAGHQERQHSHFPS